MIPHELADRFRLGWSHTVTPVTLSDANERRFYAVGAVAGSSGVRELERQIDSGLFERLALSRNKNEVKKLADRGLVVEQAAAVIENLYWQDAQRCLGPRPGESGVGKDCRRAVHFESMSSSWPVLALAPDPPSVTMSVAAWLDLDEDAPGELVRGQLTEEEVARRDSRADRGLAAVDVEKLAGFARPDSGF